MARRADIVAIRITPSDDIERPEISKASKTRQISVVDLKARDVTKRSIERAIFFFGCRDGGAQAFHGFGLIRDPMRCAQRRFDRPRLAISSLAGKGKANLRRCEIEHEFFEQQRRRGGLIDLAVPSLEERYGRSDLRVCCIRRRFDEIIELLQ